MDDKDVHDMAFVAHNRLYKFTRMTFALKNTSATFLQAKDVIPATVKLQYAPVYIDDIDIFLKNTEEQPQHTEVVFTLLDNAGMTVTLKKFLFISETIEYMGHIIAKRKVICRNYDYKSYRSFVVSKYDIKNSIISLIVQRLPMLRSKFCKINLITKRKIEKRRVFAF